MGKNVLTCLSFFCAPEEPGWRNWQTQRTQNPPTFGSWGFDSPSRHHLSLVVSITLVHRWNFWLNLLWLIMPIFMSKLSFSSNLQPAHGFSLITLISNVVAVKN